MKNIDVKEEIRNFIKRFKGNTENNVKLPSPISIEDMAEKNRVAYFSIHIKKSYMYGSKKWR